jgi:hypothetical protein
VSDDALSKQLARAIAALDVEANPRRVEEGARLLRELQAATREQERLAAHAEAFIAGTALRVAPRHKSLADWAEEVLLASPGPRRYREIAAEIRASGFQHTRTPKSPDQLSDSVWSAMYEDDRFVRVGRGIWELTARQLAAGDPPEARSTS